VTIGQLAFWPLAILGYSIIIYMVIGSEIERRCHQHKINLDDARPCITIMAKRGMQVIINVEEGSIVTVDVQGPKPQQAKQFLFYVGGKQVSDMNLTTTQKEHVVAQPADNHDNPAPVKDGTVPTWASVTPGIVSLFPNDTGLEADVQAIAVGTTDVRVSGLSAKGVAFSSTFSVAVTLAIPEATHFKFTFGAPTEQ